MSWVEFDEWLDSRIDDIALRAGFKVVGGNSINGLRYISDLFPRSRYRYRPADSDRIKQAARAQIVSAVSRQGSVK